MRPGEQIGLRFTRHVHREFIAQILQREVQRPLALTHGISPPFTALVGKLAQQGLRVRQPQFLEQNQHGLRRFAVRLAVQLVQKRLPGFGPQLGGLLDQLHPARTTGIERRALQYLHEPAVKSAQRDAGTSQ